MWMPRQPRPSVQPYFVVHGNVCGLLARRITSFYDSTVEGPEGLITRGHGNAPAQAIQIYEGTPSGARHSPNYFGESPPQPGRRMATPRLTGR